MSSENLSVVTYIPLLCNPRLPNPFPVGSEGIHP